MLCVKNTAPLQGAERLAEGDAREERGVEGAAQLLHPRRHEGPARPPAHLRSTGEYRGETSRFR